MGRSPPPMHQPTPTTAISADVPTARRPPARVKRQPPTQLIPDIIRMFDGMHHSLIGRNGMEWNGMEWNGMEQTPPEWNGLTEEHHLNGRQHTQQSTRSTPPHHHHHHHHHHTTRQPFENIKRGKSFSCVGLARTSLKIGTPLERRRPHLAFNKARLSDATAERPVYRLHKLNPLSKWKHGKRLDCLKRPHPHQAELSRPVYHRRRQTRRYRQHFCRCMHVPLRRNPDIDRQP